MIGYLIERKKVLLSIEKKIAPQSPVISHVLFCGIVLLFSGATKEEANGQIK